MKLYTTPSKEKWKELVRRPAFDGHQLTATVQSILQEVRTNGDEAVRKYTTQFDGADLKNNKVAESEITEAIASVPGELRDAIKVVASNIRKFHEAQKSNDYSIETMPGVQCWRKTVAIEKVGLYIPGGTAPLFSTVLMLGIPAAIAGCREVILCTPPDKTGAIHPAILLAAKEVGITKIFKAGGVQAIGAMAYGTATIPPVYKIFGPGNQYVTAAKQQVNREGVAIDLPAGPSEVAIFADETAQVNFVAADLLSQAEHGADSQVLLVTTYSQLAGQVQKEIEKQLQQIPRKHIAMKALENSKIIMVNDAAEAMDLLNEYAPEHLILACKDALTLSAKVINAGSVFIGNYSPESVGDYASGTNHTLPTNGNARAYSGVSVQSFVKHITFQQLTQKGLELIGRSVEVMAEAEGLHAHKHAVTVRLTMKNKQEGKLQEK